MKKITVEIVPTRSASSFRTRRETHLQKLRREVRGFFKPSYAGYSED
jgi:hypothetical protein